MNTREGLRSVAVVGGGLTALFAAIAFARSLPRAEVTLIATPPDPGALADRLPAVDPQGMAIFASLGVSERALVAAGAATHRVGERFAWGTAPFAIGEGEGVPMLAGAALHQLWLAYPGGAFGELVPGAALAAAERFVHPVEDPGSLLSRIDYSLRLDPERAAPLFAQAARAAGVRIVGAARVAAIRTDGEVEAIGWDGGRASADLFVDASGPAAVLADPDAAWVDWRATLPIDRLLLAAGAACPSPTDSYEAVPDGWSARWPLAGRTLTGFAHASTITSDARAQRQAGGERIALRPRRRVAPFTGRVLALGDAAAAVGPLGWRGMMLALAQLELALELMPARTPEPLLVAEYNRRAGLRAERVHAWCAAFYRVGSRKGAFWHAARKAAMPAELAEAHAQFGQRGTLPPIEEEMVPRPLWRQALIGLGVAPARRDPVALSVPQASAAANLAQLRGAVRGLAATLPAYPDYLARMMR